MSSNNVDERVVKMSFDNAQFEAGVKQTLTSLEELKQSLKFNNSLTGIQALSSAFNSFSLANITTQLDALTSRFSTLGIAGMTAIENITNKVLNFTASKIQGTIGQISTGGWARASSIAQARFTLQGLLNDEEKVKEAFDSASSAVDGTAYSLNAAVSVASQLAASGIDVGEEMENTLKGIAGTAAMTGDSFESIGNIFTTVAGNGRLMGMQLSQLSYHGLNAAATIAKYLGTTEDAVREMTSKGEISFDTFSKAMQSAFGEHAKDANKTFNGSMDNIKSALSRIGAIFSSGIIENDDLINALNSVRLTINSIKTAMMPLEDKFKNFVSALSNAFSGILGEFDVSPFETFINIVGSAMDTITELINKWSEAKGYLKEAIFGEDADKKIEATAEQLERANEAIQKANDIWEKAAYGVGEKRKELLGEDYDLVQALVNQRASGITDLQDAAVEMVVKSDEAMKAQNQTIAQTNQELEETPDKLHPIVEVVKSFTSFASGFRTIMNFVKTTITKAIASFKKIFSWQDLIDDIKTYGTLFSDFIGEFELTEERSEKLETALTGLWSAFDLLRMIVKALAGGLSKTLGPVLSILFDALLTIAAKTGEIITAFRNWYRENDVLKAALELLGTIVKNVVYFVADFFEKLDQLPAIEKIKDALSKLGDLLGDSIIGLFGDATEATEKFFGGLNEGDSSKMDEILSTINTALENMINFASSAQGSVSGLFDWIKGNVTDLLGFQDGVEGSGEKLKKLKSIGENVASSKSLNEFTTNISTGLSQLGFGVDKFVSWIIEKFNQLDAAKVAVIGFGTSLTALGLSASYLTYNVAEAVKAFTAFPTAVVGTIRSFGQVFTGIRQYLNNKSQAELVKMWAIAIGTLAASLFVLSNYTDPENLKVAFGAIGGLLIIMAASAKMLSDTAMISGQSKEYFKTISSFAAFFISLAASAYILTEALKNLDSLSWDRNIIAPCLALATILIALVGLVKVASTFDMDDSFTKVGVGILLFSAGVWLVAKAMQQLNDVNLDGIYDKVFALIGIIATLATFSLVASKLSFGSAMGVLSIIGSIWLIELALKYIVDNGVSLSDIADNMDKFGVVLLSLGILAIYMIAVAAACKGATNIALNIVATAVSIYIVTKALEHIAEVPFTGILKALFTLAVIFVGVRLLINQLSANQIASNAGKNLLKIALAMAILAAVVALIGNVPMETLGKGMLVVTVLTILVGALIYVSQFSKNLDYKALYAIVAAIGVMSLCVALISFIDDLESVYAAAGIMSLMMLSLGMSLYLAGKYAKRLQTGHLVVMVVALTLIAGSLFLLSQYGDIGKMVTAAVSICGILLVIATSLALIKKAMGNTDFGKNNRIGMMILMISMLAAVAASLYFLSLNDPTSVAVSALAIISVFGTVVLLLGNLVTSLKGASFDSKVLLILASVALMIGVIAAALYVVIEATKGVPYENVLASLIALSTLMIVVTGIANYLSTMTSSYDIKTFATVVSVCAMLVVVAYALKMVLDVNADWERMVSAAASMGIIILAVAAVIAALGALTAGTGTMPMLVVLVGLSAVLLSLAVTFVAFAKAATVVVDALAKLASIDMSNIDTGKLLELVMVLAGVALVCAIAGPALISLSLGIVAVSISIAALAIGLAVLAIPFALVTGLVVVLTNSFKILAAVFKDSKDDIIEGLTSIGIGLANGINGFIQTIADNSETISNNVSTILLNILTAFINFRNQAVITIAEGILQFLDIVDQYGPQIADKATETLLDILGSLAQNAGKFAVLGTYIVATFVVGVLTGLSQRMGEILNAAAQFAISFIYGIADTIYANTQPLIDSMKYLGLVLIRELIAAFNIAGVFDDSLAEIDGEIEYQKSLREQEGEEAKEAFNTGINNVDNAEIGEIDTSKATQSLSNGGTAGANAYGTSFFNGLGDKVSSFTSGDGVASALGLGDGTGFDVAGMVDGNAYVDNINKTFTEHKVDASSIPEEVKKQLKSEGYTYDDTGEYLVKQVETSINNSSEDINLDTAGNNILDNIINEGDTTAKGEEGLEWFVKGFENLDDSQQSRLFEVGETIGNKVYEGAAAATEVQSPSRKAMYIRDMFVEGLTMIGSDLTNKVYSAYGNVGNDAVNATAETMSSISKVMQDESIDWQPTLMPVIDDSQLQNGSNLLTATFGNSALNLAADTALSVKDNEASNLATQVAELSAQVKKLADTDYSKMLDGVSINVDASTNVDGTPLRKMASNYTIKQIDAQQSNYNMSRGARA